MRSDALTKGRRASQSAQLNVGRGWRRRRTMTSCRSTRISTSLVASERASSASQLSRRAKSRSASPQDHSGDHAAPGCGPGPRGRLSEKALVRRHDTVLGTHTRRCAAAAATAAEDHLPEAADQRAPPVHQLGRVSMMPLVSTPASTMGPSTPASTIATPNARSVRAMVLSCSRSLGMHWLHLGMINITLSRRRALFPRAALPVEANGSSGGPCGVQHRRVIARFRPPLLTSVVRSWVCPGVSICRRERGVSNPSAGSAAARRRCGRSRRERHARAGDRITNELARWVWPQLAIDHVEALDLFRGARTIGPLLRSEVSQVDAHDDHLGRSRRRG
jgi:hypothetical protein